MQRVRPTVAGARAAFEQSAPLELVDQRHHTTRGNTELLAHRLLGVALTRTDHAQQRELARLELQRRETRREPPRHRVPERGEHEADRSKRRRFRAGGTASTCATECSIHE